MSQLASAEIMSAVYARLIPNGVLDSVLAANGITGVFPLRGVPTNQPFDYITIGDHIDAPKNTFGRRGYNVMFTFHIWSRAESTDPAELVSARLNELFDQQPLSLASQSLVSLMFDSAHFIADSDGLTLHVVHSFNIYTEE